MDAKYIFGCALGIFDGTDWTKATMDNMVIFSVQAACVKQKMTSFDVSLPSASGAIMEDTEHGISFLLPM